MVRPMRAPPDRQPRLFDLDAAPGPRVKWGMRQSKTPKPARTPGAPDIPDDLKQALLMDGKAWEIFNALPPSHQREYTAWIEEAKQEETRRRRIQKTVAMLLEKG